MLKSLRNIIIILLLVVSIWGIHFFWGNSIVHLAIDMIDEIVQDTRITINDDKIKTEEKYYSSFAKFDHKNISVQRTIYADEVDYENQCKQPQNVKVYLNNKLLKEESNAKWTETSYNLSNTMIVIKNSNITKGSEYSIRINYEYNTTDAIIEYSNLTTLKLMTEKWNTQNNIKIQLPKETEIFKLNSKAKVEFLGNNTYSIKGNMKQPYSELLMDKGIVKNTRIVDKKYETSNIKRALMAEDSETIYVLYIMLIVTLTTLVITLLITKKPKIKKIYTRNPEEVIEPILAKSIIDRRIGAKELIMSCIVELISRGNLKNIENDKITLIHRDNLTKYELEILGLLFEKKNQTLTFKKIEEMFIDNNQKTQDFFDKFNNIKNEIEERLYDCNIYSKTGKKVLKTLRALSIVGIIDIAYLFYRYYQGKSTSIHVMFWCTIIAIAFAIFQVSNKKINNNNIKIIQSGKIGMRLAVILIGIIIWIIFDKDKNVVTLLIIGLIFAMNILTYAKTKLYILTPKGKCELEKAQGLKNYILDYSLMKERELKSVIIWDEFLAYAVAFGIPNKITDIFNENLMNTNIVIQRIESILKM